ncbi:MAG TPA: VOC family protein, partial [Candidatus Saccharimonadales bacterium]|nr:VOC family protein [Candidatus Saccharimonadales bacterium]
PNSRITATHRAPADNPSTEAGEVLTVDFELDGRSFIALDGGPEFTFTEALSLSIDCEDQAEVDRYWDALVEGGGEHSVCGWLKDRFGVSWQVVPRQLQEMLDSDDRAGAKRAMEAMLKMRKLDVEQLRDAFEGVPA